jgi:hypothetical protein
MQWEASNGARFDLNSNTLRPFGWTSGDAAGLPMFPALVRYDECERGLVEHGMRLVVKRTRLGPIYPATHQASVGSATDPNVPAMGQRLRLRADFKIPRHWTKHERAVLLGLKKYGAIVADNGGFFVARLALAEPGCVVVSWTDGAPPYVVQATPSLPAAPWTAIATTTVNTIKVPATGQTQFFRVQGQ